MRRRGLLVTIAEEEARLTSLEADLATARGRLAGLRAELHECDNEPRVHVSLPIVVSGPVPNTVGSQNLSPLVSQNLSPLPPRREVVNFAQRFLDCPV